MHGAGVQMEHPFAVGVSDQRVALASWFTGSVQGLDPANGKRRTVADKLPIGLSGGPGMPPPCVATGVDVGPDGTVYFSANRNNAIYRIRPVR